MEKMYKLQIGKTAVYEECISLTIDNLFSKFIWFGRSFYLPIGNKDIFIPANANGWKWVLDDRDVTTDGSSLKLISGEDSLSYISIHYNKADTSVPHPINYSLHTPEFMGNYLSVTTEDSMCRVKSILHPIDKPLELDKYIITFKKLKGRNVDLEIHD